MSLQIIQAMVYPPCRGIIQRLYGMLVKGLLGRTSFDSGSLMLVLASVPPVGCSHVLEVLVKLQRAEARSPISLKSIATVGNIPK